MTLLEGIPRAELQNKRSEHAAATQSSEHDNGVHQGNWGSLLVPDKEIYLRFASKDGSDS